MERIKSESVHEGVIAEVVRERWRHADGSEVEREVVVHPGAVAVLAHDDSELLLVRQPREAVEEDGLLELPAGKLDVSGEGPLETAKRELAEETGIRAREWSELKQVYTSPGFARERVWIYEATGLIEGEPDPDPGERIEVVRWPLDELEGAIVACSDAKSLIGMLLLAARLGPAVGG